MKLLRELIEFIMREHKKLQRLYKAATVLACIVVFVTTYALMLPAISLDKKTASRQTGLRLDPAKSPAIEMAADGGREDANSELGAAVPGSGDETGGGRSSGAGDESVAAGADTADDGTGDNDVVSASDDGSGDEADGTSGGESDTGVEDTGSDLDDGDDPGTYDSDASADSDGADRESADSEASDYEAADAGDDAEDSTYDEAGSTSDPADTTITEDSTGDAAAAIAATALLALQEDEFITEETELTAEGDGYKVYVTVDAKAMLPKAATVSVREINKEKDEKEFALYFDKAQKELRDKYDDSTSLAFARFYDISFLYEGVKIEPASPVKVRFEFDRDKEPEVARKARIDMIHFDEFEFEEKMLTETERSKFIESDRSEFIESEMKTGDKAKILTGAGIELGSQEPFNDDDVYVVNGGVSKGGTFSGSSNDAGTYTKNRRYSKSARKSSIEEISDVQKLSEFEFSSDQFSVYGVLGTVIEKIVIGSDGNSYKINVTYGAEAEVPEGAGLETMEIVAPEGEDEDSISSEGNDEVEELADTSLYDTYVSKIEETLGLEAGSASNVRLFDIRIEDQDGEKVDIQAPVKVEIELADADDILGEETRIIHFAADSGTGDVIDDFEVDGDTISFTADGFSAYAIVEGPPPVDVPDRVMTVEELAQNYVYENGFYLSYGTNTINYFTNQVKSNTVYVETQELGDASVWYFESAGENKYYVCTDTASGKQYMYNTSGNNMNLSATNKTAFVVSRAKEDGKFYFKADGQNKWLQHSGTGGGIRLYTDNNNDTNSRIIITYVPEEPEDDPYKLDGLTYGLMNWSGEPVGRALMANAVSTNALEAKALTTMCNEDNTSQLFVPSDSDISMWTFEWISDDQYYLKANVDGEDKYLRIAENGVSIVSSADERCKIQVFPGTGTHSGQIYLKSGNKTLTYSGSLASGFSVTGSAGSEWLNLVTVSELTSEYFMTHTAQKVSVSDPDVKNTSKVIVYTRVWNDTSKKYEYYAIDSDGSLLQVFDSGDYIQWGGGQFNSLLWDFVEYFWEGTTDPNYYYELYNEYSEQFIAPQVTDGQIISDSAIGINMNGRRQGYYYSPIVAWDEDNYAYAGLKADIETGKVVSCPLEEAQDFYFAIVQDGVITGDELTKVTTVNNNLYGITMKMIDFDSRTQMSDFLGNDNNASYDRNNIPIIRKNLLSTNLNENGYPTVVINGNELSDLYSGSQTVNHLFIQSIYDESGYFEYDSSQNFASLHGEEFVVYKELGTYDSAGSRSTLKHGQFFPYNDIKPGVFATVNGKNLYSALADFRAGHEDTGRLDNGNPRKYEQLYSIENSGKDANCQFGMELEASFTQTPNGKDDWGHDIIFEFTGDDDFWLYVNGELVIDLGGIHSAVPGSVNFATGAVNVNGTQTTLRALFESNYRNRNPQATEGEVSAFLNLYFDEGETVFRENTTNTMRIFYMERGGGASNLHMRFNLASIRPGHVLLSKELSGVSNPRSFKAEFPYQIYYTLPDDPDEHLLTNDNPLDIKVYYKDTVRAVAYKPSLTIDGISYRSVFMLKPGEVADISVPNGAISYRIVECGVDNTIYKNVTVKEDNVEEVTRDTRSDYTITKKEMSERPRVTYVNEVDPDALKTLSFEKVLFKEDGTTRIRYDEDSTLFNFRLYLGTEYGDIEPADMQVYYVKNNVGEYCRWDSTLEKPGFVSLGTGKVDLDQLSEEEKLSATFHTSMNGMISKIPVDYTVEIQEVLAGTKYRVEERDNEIPDGYSRQKYILHENGDTIVTDINDAYVDGTVDPDPHIEVCNLKGFGLRINKEWSDKDYMAERAPTYFAVFTKEQDGTLIPVTNPNTVRQLSFDAAPQTLYWYFEQLPVAGVLFKDYVVREVTLTGENLSVNGEGYVTGYSTVNPIVYPDDQVTISGRQTGQSSMTDYTYTVIYDDGSIEDGANVHVFEAENSRPGVKLYKMDGDTPLANAKFRLTKGDDLIGVFTSDENGLVTEAFLLPGETYTYELMETNSPQGYQGIQHPIQLSLGADNTLTVVDEYGDSHSISPTPGETMPTYTIQNKRYEFRVVKKDQSGQTLSGATFELHKQKTVGGHTAIDVDPESGYENMTTDENGVITELDSTLPPGTYELREIAPPSGYEVLSGYIQFTISETGTISLVEDNYPEEEVELITDEETDPDKIIYKMTITNKRSSVTLRKEDDSGNPIPGAIFVLKTLNSSNVWVNVGADGEIDMSELTEVALPTLVNGRYRLEEQIAPDGYIILDNYVFFAVQSGTVTLTDDAGKTIGPVTEHVVLSGDSQYGYILTVKNTPGAELPSSGESGSDSFRLIGFVLAVVACAGLLWNRRRV